MGMCFGRYCRRFPRRLTFVPDSGNCDAGFSFVGGIGVEGEQNDSFDWLAPPLQDSQDMMGSHALCSHHHDQLQHHVEPMDLDFEFDSLSWTDELDLDVGFDLHDSSATQGFGNVDFLVTEDEPAFAGFVTHDHIVTDHMPDTHMHDPSASMMMAPVSQWQHAPTPHPAGVEDPTPERLRSQLSLLSEGSCGDELVFKNCDSSKAMLLHGLAMDFGLNYTHDAPTGEVSIARAGTIIPFKQSAPSLVVTSPFQNSSFQGISFPSEVSLESASVQSSIISPPPDTSQQQVARRQSRSQRISDSIIKHVSTWKTSMAKGGGRRGPLTEDGRRDMKVLEGAGGACWRCKVLRRKASSFFIANRVRPIAKGHQTHLE